MGLLSFEDYHCCGFKGNPTRNSDAFFCLERGNLRNWHTCSGLMVSAQGREHVKGVLGRGNPHMPKCPEWLREVGTRMGGRPSATGPAKSAGRHGTPKADTFLAGRSAPCLKQRRLNCFPPAHTLVDIWPPEQKSNQMSSTVTSTGHSFLLVANTMARNWVSASGRRKSEGGSK